MSCSESVERHPISSEELKSRRLYHRMVKKMICANIVYPCSSDHFEIGTNFFSTIFVPVSKIGFLDCNISSGPLSKMNKSLTTTISIRNSKNNKLVLAIRSTGARWIRIKYIENRRWTGEVRVLEKFEIARWYVYTEFPNGPVFCRLEIGTPVQPSTLYCFDIRNDIIRSSIVFWQVKEVDNCRWRRRRREGGPRSTIRSIPNFFSFIITRTFVFIFANIQRTRFSASGRPHKHARYRGCKTRAARMQPVFGGVIPRGGAYRPRGMCVHPLRGGAKTFSAKPLLSRGSDLSGLLRTDANHCPPHACCCYPPRGPRTPPR